MNEGAQRLNFVSLMDDVEEELKKGGGPFFLGKELSMVDCMFAPFLERMAASLPYYKGLPIRRQPQVCVPPPRGMRSVGCRSASLLDRYSRARHMKRATLHRLRTQVSRMVCLVEVYARIDNVCPLSFAPRYVTSSEQKLCLIPIILGFSIQWPNVEAWFLAMESKPSYRNIASDFYTHFHDLPPQIGRCQVSGPEAQAFADRIDGADGRAWRLPLPPLDEEPQPLGGFGQDEDAAKREAAERIIANHKAVVRFAARAGGGAGFPPVSAPLSDPRAGVFEASIPQVDAALRHTVHALLVGPDNALAQPSEGLESPIVTASLGYLRDRISVPRDMGAPAARQLRAHLNEVIERVGAATVVA